jgi:hypothetical protein
MLKLNVMITQILNLKIYLNRVRTTHSTGYTENLVKL